MPRSTARARDALSADALRALTEVVDGGLSLRRGDAARLVRIRIAPAEGIDDDEVEVGFRPVEGGAHPLHDLVGFRAPADWAAIGVAATGRAVPMVDTPGGVRPGPGPALAVRSVHLVARSGAWACRWQPLDGGDDATGAASSAEAATAEPPPTGRVDDALRRTLGLPTAPPPGDTRVLWAVQWLDALLAAAADGPTGRRRLRPLPALVAAHPAVRAFDLDPATVDVERLVAEGIRLAAWRDWARLRQAGAAGAWSDPEVDAATAAWLDDGAFARWVLAGWPELADLRAALGDLLAPSATSVIDDALAGWGLDGGPAPPAAGPTVTGAGHGGQ